jgi:dihydroorotate dehydrogenase (fumarate)
MDLRTTYMGLELKHPIVASASPLSESLDNIKRMEDAGAAAIVMFSLFEEQIRHENAAMEHFMAAGTDSFAESLSYFPEVGEHVAGPDNYLDLLRRAAEATDIPIIGSLNCVTSEGWADMARMMEQAGARGIELNVYFIPSDITLSGRDVEQRYLDAVRSAKSAVEIPVALKLSPFFSSIGHMVQQLAEAGADALVLFNRFYQPDFDLDHLEVLPNLSLSSPGEIRLPLLWIAILFGRIKSSLGASRGVHGPGEALKYILAGADAVMTTSALLRHGIDYLGELVHGLEQMMSEKGYESVAQAKGRMSHRKVADPSAFERANYIKVLESYRGPETV